MPKVRILPRSQVNFYSSFTLTIVKNASLFGGNADVAQLVERHSCKVRVVGSIPTVSSTKHICLVVYTDQPKSPAGVNLGKCRIKSELRGICGIRIMASISGFQPEDGGSTPLSRTILDPLCQQIII